MAGRKGAKHMTEKTYEQVKALLELGLKTQKIAEIMERTAGTVSRVKNTKDFAEYLEVGRAYQAKRQAKLAVDVPVVDTRPEPKEDFSLIFTKLDQIATCLNTLLDVIQDKEAKANASFWKR